MTTNANDGSPETVAPALSEAPATTSHKRVLAWGLWDWGSAAFNAVVTTFVFTVYLTSDAFGGEAEVSAQLGWALAAAGVLIAVLAPRFGVDSRGLTDRPWKHR